jgi:prepilin-type N-terminal cleavage/methylation domain-containing protein
MKSQVGYSLIEMLIVTALIGILATIPIALLRRSRDKTYEMEALRSLRMISLAYENYYMQNGHKYPHYQSNGAVTEENEFRTAEEIWDTFVAYSLLPHMYSGTRHDRQDLLGKGYVFTIFPSDSGVFPGDGIRNSYAFAMVPYEGSVAEKGLAMVQGRRWFSSFPTAIPRKMNEMGMYSLQVYSMND